ncbi:MAG: carboxypeptidase-like regulatory domain-containing protein [Gemmatimonadales bacterium]
MSRLVPCGIAGVILSSFLMLGTTTTLGAQSITGQVVDAETGADLAGALISAADPATGIIAARAISSGSGRFRIVVARTGAWRLTVAAIGYSPVRMAVTMADSVVAVPQIRLARHAFRLPEIVAAASGSTCRPDTAGAPVLDRLIREAETALGLVQATIDSRRLEFATETWNRRSFVGSADTLRGKDVARGRASWPIASADPGQLQREGFVHDPGEERTPDGFRDDAGPVYYGPDAGVLFSPWFLASHCFAVAGGSAGSLRISFAPRGIARRADVEGELVIDPATSSLTAIVFRYVGLPGWVPAGSAGGEVTFKRLDDGLWIVSSWKMRAPIRLENGSPRPARVPRFVLGGWAEVGGMVTEVVEH